MSTQRRGGWILPALLFVSLSSVVAETPRPEILRKLPTASKTAEELPAIAVTHSEEEDGWFVAETENFRLYHQHTIELAEDVLRTAERTRTAQLRKWFGDGEEVWRPKCRILLYPSSESYSDATGVPGNVNGNTQIRLDGERVLWRCIHLHGRRNELLPAVLPHEVTHAVLAGRFGGTSVPRWADEGIAVLAETQARIDAHLRQLPRWRNEERLFRVRDLFELRKYPQAKAIGAFYAQSVSLVEFLTREKDAKRVAAFIRDGERNGYEASLKRHYGWSFDELDRRWRRYAFPENKSIGSSGGN